MRGLWDIFCRVVDNYGDIGVAWRLAADLAGRGQPVRLWVDDASALAWMAPQGAAAVRVGRFDDAATVDAPGTVVIETFGCDPPPAFVARMAAAAAPPVWLNLEYLSAEPYVERSHGLPSPQPGGLMKWFFYPGFTARTGGLLREPGLLAAHAAWAAGRPAPAAQPTADQVASVFCYPNPALPELARDWPGRLRLAPGAAQSLPATRGEHLAWRPQADYDRLLAGCDLNLVRGEDSLVRAIWAARPFVWQIYPQHDGVHRTKLDAFLDRFLDGTPAGLAAAVRQLWWAWNGFAPWPARPWPDFADWQSACEAWRSRLAAQDDLVTQLLAFVAARHAGGVE